MMTKPQNESDANQSLAAFMRPRRNYFTTVLSDTLGPWGARFGLVFLIFVGILAVAAPFLANSHPYAMKTIDGSVSYPLFEYLSAGDVALLTCTIAGLVISCLRMFAARSRWRIFIVVSLICISSSYLFVSAPTVVKGGLRRYRDMAAARQIEWAIYAPIPFSASDRSRDQPDKKGKPPSAEHWFGTEQEGADVLSRMIHACRVMLSIGFISTGIALLIGVTFGAMMGYFSGIVDLLGMRILEIIQSVPQLYLLLAFVAFFDPGEWMLYFLMVIIGLTSWTGYARFTRAEFLRLRQQDFVQAARACGIPLHSILFRHMLPNGVAPVLVSATFGVASAILAEATLSFLGLGLEDEPSWGQLLEQATGSSGGFVWWIATFPGGAIFLTVFAYTLIGESLRDAIDPKLKKAAQL